MTTKFCKNSATLFADGFYATKIVQNKDKGVCLCFEQLALI